MTPDNGIKFVCVDKNLTLDYIRLAKKRLLIAKPGYYSEEIAAVKEILENSDCRCNLFIEEGDGPVRLGLGDVGALKEIDNLLDSIGFAVADSIRLSVILVDDMALFYVPAALKWEEEKDADKLTFPNGIMMTGCWVDSIYDIYLSRMPAPDILDNIIPFKNCTVPPMDTEGGRKKNEEAIKKLDEDKPVDPMNLQKFRFYKNNYKIVRINCTGTSISRKTISLERFNKLFGGKYNRLRSSWNAIDVKDAVRLTKLADPKKEIEAIKKRYGVISAGRFGGLIKKEKKNKLEKLLQLLENSVRSQNRRCKGFKSFLKELKIVLEVSEKELVNYLERQITNDEDALRNFRKHNVLGMEYFVWYKLKFPTVSDIIDSFSIKMDIYDISDELLQHNEDFQQILLDNPQIQDELRTYGEGYKVKDK
ncbi:MAG TPA: hypothetical protein PLA03_11715 [Acidobacteriota bacterium]|nr:hypothetical protein [Acidobacteriota bacterium]